MVDTAGNRRTFHRIAERYQLKEEVSLLKSKRLYNNTCGLKLSNENKRIDNKDIFVRDSIHPRKLAKKRIIQDKLIPYKCSFCGNIGIWRGKEITLQLDHINGINNDHRLENLRFLCPNCHTQTPTYGNKKEKIQIIKYLKVPNICAECGTGIEDRAKHCKACENKSRKVQLKLRKVIRPAKEELYKMLQHTSFLHVGHMFRVSDNAVRKWCKAYEIPHTSGYYRKKYNHSTYYK
jgi:5-methylcytosine-specific restriction endonuclease McrA